MSWALSLSLAQVPDLLLYGTYDPERGESEGREAASSLCTMAWFLHTEERAREGGEEEEE